MLAKICEGIPDAIAQLRDHGGRFLAEFKYDGVRAQIHLLDDGLVSSSSVLPAPTPRDVAVHGHGKALSEEPIMTRGNSVCGRASGRMHSACRYGPSTFAVSVCR